MQCLNMYCARITCNYNVHTEYTVFIQFAAVSGTRARLRSGNGGKRFNLPFRCIHYSRMVCVITIFNMLTVLI